MKLLIILGNQLFDCSYLNKLKDHEVFMCEDYDLCTYEKHHKQKILFFLSSMRSYAEELKKNNFKINYLDINQDFKKDYFKKLEALIKKKSIKEISFFEIEDKPFEKRLLAFLQAKKIKYNQISSPMFICSRNDFKDYLKKYKKPFMANFYKEMRIKNKVLLDKNNNPVGGKWSFDKDNRKKISENIKIPNIPKTNETTITKKLKPFIETNFKDHPGSTSEFWFPTTRKEALNLLDDFFDKRLNLFGDYEDAVTHRSNIVFHSALSPLINVGLITPQIILNKINKYSKKIKINSLEGYTRQIIGWREFMRGIYQNYDEKLFKSNFFKHKRKMKPSWYNGTTGLDPLDHAIKNAIKHGWSHHIERLMILSNIMNLCGINPLQVYKWFMEMFVDSSDWVMAPNVFGMGLFSDGGTFATKPYICGSSYILKMMEFKKGPWCDVLDGLYWKFIEQNQTFFKSNPRLSMMVVILKKMNQKRKNVIFTAANQFIKDNTYDS